MHTLAQISEQTGLSVRTIRYYIQKGLVERPEGARKTARYGEHHLEQLLTIKRLSSEGLSLAAIERLMFSGDSLPATSISMTSTTSTSTTSVSTTPSSPMPGTIRQLSQIQLAPGVTLQIDAQQCPLSQAQLRKLSQQLLDTFNTHVQEAP